jgi:hypothetical protein
MAKIQKHARYHLLSAADKEAEAVGRMREPPIVCPHCETKVMAADLLAHVAERCAGRPDPHPLSRWITWRQAEALGVSRVALHRWALAGRVRATWDGRRRLYLQRDVAAAAAQKSTPGRVPAQASVRCDRETTNKHQPNGWTKGRRRDHRRFMDQPLNPNVRKRLDSIAKDLGGVAATSRRLDIPERTLRKALRGDNLRKGTRVLIETQLGQVEAS